MTEALLKTLLVNSLVFAALFGVVMALRAALRTRLSATLSLALWAVLALKLALPFGFESVLSPFGWFASAPPAQQPVVTTTATAQGLPTKPLGEPQPESISLPLPITATHAPAQPIVSSQTVAAVQPSTASAPLRWTDWALLIWASGAAGVAMWLLLGQLALNRRLRAAAEPTATALAALHSCKAELGIRTQVALRVLPGGTPAVAGVLRPMVLLADGLDDADALRPVLLHELNHFRNGDLLAILLMNFLTVIYWFHPLVWALFALVRRDMETRCDQQVLSRLSREGGLDYVSTLLRFSGYGAGERLRAALGMGSGRALMERRIRDMFRSRRADAATRAVTLVAAVVLLAASLLTACQPTPEKPAVINKNDGLMEKQIAEGAKNTTPTAIGLSPAVSASTNQSPAPSAYNAPATWKADFEQGNLTVNIDATVVVPKDTAFPVARIVPMQWSQQTVDRFISVLMQGKTIYPVRDMDKDLSRPEILQKIADLNSGKNSDLFTSDPKAYKVWAKPQIKKLQDMLKTAPEAIERIPSDGKLQPVYLGDMPSADESAAPSNTAGPQASAAPGKGNSDVLIYERLDVEADLGFANRAILMVHENTNGKNNTLFFMSGAAGPNRVMEGELDNLPGLSITAEQGAQIARELVSDLGYNDMSIAKTMSCATPPSRENGSTTIVPYAQFPRCYVYSFTHTVQGMVMQYNSRFNSMQLAQYGRTGEAPNPYTERWIEEYLTVYVNDSGVIAVEIRSPSEVAGIVAPNVGLLPFDQIQQRFAQQFKYEGGWNDLDKLVYAKIAITHISLGLVRVPEKNNPSQALLVPAWEFFGNGVESFGDGSQDTLRSDEPGSNFLTINAIDGTVIQRDVEN